MPALAHHARPRWIAAILFAFGAFMIVVALPRHDPGPFHDEFDETRDLIVGGILGLPAIALSVGVWLGHEWSRLMGGVGSLSIFGLFICGELATGHSLGSHLEKMWRRPEYFVFVLLVWLLAWAGIQCLRPSTRVLLEEVRAARARRRLGKAGARRMPDSTSPRSR